MTNRSRGRQTETDTESQEKPGGEEDGELAQTGRNIHGETAGVDKKHPPVFLNGRGTTKGGRG